MSMTARLSKLFRHRSGDELVGEVADRRTPMDASDRSELREPDVARLDAKLELRVAELSARIDLPSIGAA